MIWPLVGCQKNAEQYRIGILQWTETVDAFNQTYKGVVDGLAAKGYREGLNLRIDYRDVEQDRDLALKAAQDFVRNKVDLIVALGTGSSLAALEATRKHPIPIVFSVVGAPRATGVIHDYNDPGRNITGVSMKVPVKEQFQVFKEMLPNTRTLGILYCTEMPQAVATGEEAAAAASAFGWTPVTMSFPKGELPHLAQKVEALAQKVDAIYVPTDPILGAPDPFGTIIRISDAHKIPVLVVTKKHVEEKGALAALHCDFYEIGRQAADPISQVLAGVDVRAIPSQKPIIKKLSIHLGKARELGIEIKRNVILRADNIFE